MDGKSDKNYPADGDTVVANGRETKGFLRPHGREFEIFAAEGDSFVFIAIGTGADAVKLLREHASKREAR